MTSGLDPGSPTPGKGTRCSVGVPTTGRAGFAGGLVPQGLARDQEAEVKAGLICGVWALLPRESVWLHDRSGRE